MVLVYFVSQCSCVSCAPSWYHEQLYFVYGFIPTLREDFTFVLRCGAPIAATASPAWRARAASDTLSHLKNRLSTKMACTECCIVPLLVEQAPHCYVSFRTATCRVSSSTRGTMACCFGRLNKKGLKGHVLQNHSPIPNVRTIRRVCDVR
jgi:hypothetical protein